MRYSTIRSVTTTMNTAKPKSRTASDSDAAARQYRIMIVDDHPIVRRGLVAMVNQEPDLLVCAEAEDYQHALAAVSSEKPDLAVIDLALKGINGLELIKQLKSINADLPVLVLSMHDESLYAERALRAGARGYIMKQSGTEKLVIAIRAVLRGELYLSQKMATRILGKLVTGKKEESTSPVAGLSDRELEIYELIGRGRTSRQVSEDLCISVKTVESHREHIKQKLGLTSATELIRHATQWVTSVDNGGLGV